MRKTLATALALTMLGIAPASAELFCSPGRTFPGGQHQNAPPGVLVSSPIYGFFRSDGEDPRDLGTNPSLTGVTWSTTEYIDTSETYGIVHGNIDRLFVRMKSAYDLNRMAYPPPNPFYTTATLSMENDEGETVTGCDFVLGTSYARNPVAFVPTVADTEPGAPTLKTSTALAPAGVTVSAFADHFFENAGSGAEFTDAHFQTMQYYDAARTGLVDGFLEVTAKSAAQLRALPYPPPNPFRVTVTLTMTNSAGQTGQGTVTYTTHW